jgi:hypothetical protein
MADRRDSWAAAENIIPSSGATKGLKFIWPDLNMTGKAYRVPVRTGSIVELTAVVEQATSRDEVVDVFRQAAVTAPLKGVMDLPDEEWHSARIVSDPHGSLVGLPLVQVLNWHAVDGRGLVRQRAGFLDPDRAHRARPRTYCCAMVTIMAGGQCRHSAGIARAARYDNGTLVLALYICRTQDNA